MTSLVVLAVDDEPPALDELAFLLRADPRIAEVRAAGDATSALKQLEDGAVQVVFLDINMPGLNGLELARLLGRFVAPPQVVFVTAHDAAVDAFALGATDYLLKPIRQDRIGDAVRRVVDGLRTDAPPVEETIAVELAGITRFLAVAEIRYAEAHGDYARLHVADSNHLVRISLNALEERWTPLGFMRIHRSFLVATGWISELRVDVGGSHVLTPEGASLPVSRRHSRELRDRLVRRASGSGS